MNRTQLKYIFSLLLIFSLFIPIKCFTSNFHEHLFSIPFKENFRCLKGKLFTSELPIFTKEIFKEEEQWQLITKEFWPSLQGQYQSFANENLESFFLASNETSKIAFLLSLLNFEKFNYHSAKNRKIAYKINENIRKALFIKLPKEDLLSVFENYFNTEPIENRKVISVTCTQRFFQDTGKAFALQDLATLYGTKIIFRASLQRSKLMTEESIVLPKYVLDAIDSRLILGIDIVESMNETPWDSKGMQREIEKGLSSLFSFAHEKDIVIFMHAFENTSEGTFYTSLKHALKKNKFPLYLEVGHINALTSDWMDFFKDLPQVYTQFHCCLSSACTLQNYSIEKLQQTSTLLQSKGLALFLGSDGRGILPNSSYMEMSALINDDFKLGYESHLSSRCH
jgi:hypothetical protein